MAVAGEQIDEPITEPGLVFHHQDAHASSMTRRRERRVRDV
jgi:hypothetical protein